MNRVTSKGQVTIPKKVRDHLGIAPGDAVEFRVEGGLAVVRPAESARAWEMGKDLFGKHASGVTHLSRDRKRLVREKLHARRPGR
jgi:AbrB family looped-hinge helix DNA binding protein